MILESEANLHDREGVFGENDVLHHVDHPVRCHLGEQGGHNVHVNVDLQNWNLVCKDKLDAFHSYLAHLVLLHRDLSCNIMLWLSLYIRIGTYVKCKELNELQF